MVFRLFGEVELLAAGQLLDVGTPRQQTVLAALLVDAGRPVPIEALIDRIWPGGPPAGARNVLYSHLSRIRQLLRQAAVLTGEPAVVVERRHAGYVVDVDPDLVDLHRFRRLVATGRDPLHDDAERSHALGQALALWRDRPLAGLSGEWVEQVRGVWSRLKLDAVLEWARTELALGRPGDVIGTLPAVIVEHPYVEPLEDLMMRALHAAGRDAEALDRYAAARQRLVDDLGTDPGPELRAVHEAILRGELPTVQAVQPVHAVLANQANQAKQRARQVATPAQLPPDMYGFTGRASELHQLDNLLAAGRQSTAVVISALCGTAGVGKTALALHWAHRVRGDFPDGQLYVNLRGFDPSGSPVAPAEALRTFLDAFEVPPDRIPTEVNAQIGLYRSLLAERRVMVVLDNAVDCEQVRPLLPGVPGCLAIVTSRNQLGGLTATAGARPLPLDLLTVAESRDLLAGRLGVDRVSAEPRAVDDIVRSCARLPLALAIVASRAAAHPGFSLEALAAELRDSRGRLDELAGADPATDPRAVFSWSYRQLSSDAARLFLLLVLHPGQAQSVTAAASLAGVPVAAVRRQLSELSSSHLLNEHHPGRYTFHDLLRAYAAELAAAHEPADEQRTALHRMFDHYLHSAYAAALLLHPYLDPIAVAPPQPGVTVEHQTSTRAALAWLTSEHAVLLATVERAGGAGFDTHARQLSGALVNYFDRHGHWQDWVNVQNATLASARRLKDRRWEAGAHRSAACAYLRLGRLDEADVHLRRALALFGELADCYGQAHTHRSLGELYESRDEHAKAVWHGQQALDLYRSIGHRIGQALALNDIGWHQIALGAYQPALSHCRQALDIQLSLGDRSGAAHTWDSLGYAHHHLGQHEQATHCYQQSVELYQELGDHYELARTLARLGETLRAAGEASAARLTWLRAADLFDALGHPNADEVRAKLGDLSRVRPA